MGFGGVATHDVLPVLSLAPMKHDHVAISPSSALVDESPGAGVETVSLSAADAIESLCEDNAVEAPSEADYAEPSLAEASEALSETDAFESLDGNDEAPLSELHHSRVTECNRCHRGAL